MTYLLLPQLKDDSDVRASDASGQWDTLEPKAFQDVASSLYYLAPGQVKSVSSVPTMWARPLSMEMALHNPDYPIRAQMIEQWQGMLAVIALAEVRGFSAFKAELIDLEALKQESFAKSLYELLPDPVNALYTLDGKNPWQDTYVFLWNDKPVGMTSPSTLVVPAEEGDWGDLPWWDTSKKHLVSPVSYLNEKERALLWRWLENLQKEFNNHKGDPKALNRIRELVNGFRGSLGPEPQQQLSLSTNPQFFGAPINRGVLRALNIPAKAEAQPSGVRLIASSEKKGQVPDLLLIDPEIATAWDEPAQNIWVHQDQTLASLKIEDFKNSNLGWNEVRCVETEDLFLEDFKFVDSEDRLPGAFLPKGTSIVFNGINITPLLPINPILLDYFTPEDLIRRIEISSLNGGGPSIRITLDLPLSGIRNDENKPQNYRIFKDYLLQEEHALREVPVLEVWPNFKLEEWQEYYGFYYDGEYGDETFQVNFPTAKFPHVFRESSGSYQVTKLSEFPSYISCQNRERKTIGLILLRTPELVKLNTDWTVGVDFGTSFTNVYVNRKDKVEPLPLESLHLKVADVEDVTRNPVLFEYFVPEKFIPSDKPLPLSSVLTTRGQTDAESNQQEIYDGRIYVPIQNESQSFKPDEDWIETDLKWKNFVPNQLFLKHLALHISALAAKNQVQTIQWSLSFPSAFSKGDRNRYFQGWEELTQVLTASTGITHLCPEPNDVVYFRTESLAMAQYFADQEGHNLVSSTCMDLGGGTTDISIWERNQLVHQCSVQLAGRDLCAQFLEMNRSFLAKYFNQNIKEWNNLSIGQFNAKLDVLLRYESEKWLRETRRQVEDEADFKGLLRLMSLGISGLYYYVGMILGILHDDGKYKREEITRVYIGGNGSRLLNWLAIGGKFSSHSEVNALFSHMLAAGSGFNDSGEATRLSSRPKDEVACGLVLNQTKLQGLERKIEDLPIAGEDFELNGFKMSWNERLDLQDDVESFSINDLKKLREFVNEFNVTLKKLRIDGLTPMPKFKSGVGLESTYEDRLWRDTHNELENMLLNLTGDTENIRPEPPFILGLKALLKVLTKEWAGK